MPPQPIPFVSPISDALLMAMRLIDLDVTLDDYAPLRWTFLMDDDEIFLNLLQQVTLEREDVMDLCICASRFGASNILPHLLQRIRSFDPPVDFRTTGTLCLSEAASRGHATAALSLMTIMQVEPSNYLLVMASRRGHHEVVKLFLQTGRVDPSAFDSKALRVAAAHGQERVVRILLETGRVDPGTADNVAIRRASEYGHKEVVRMVLDSGMADPAAEDNYAIRWAAVNGHLEVVKMLIATPG
ncbi:hypothetical protein HDU67_001845, partial [Dinochytrium kinnereticum]